jgi:hypothetical protein
MALSLYRGLYHFACGYTTRSYAGCQAEYLFQIFFKEVSAAGYSWPLVTCVYIENHV